MSQVVSEVVVGVLALGSTAHECVLACQCPLPAACPCQVIEAVETASPSARPPFLGTDALLLALRLSLTLATEPEGRDALVGAGVLSALVVLVDDESPLQCASPPPQVVRAAIAAAAAAVAVRVGSIGAIELLCMAEGATEQLGPRRTTSPRLLAPIAERLFGRQLGGRGDSGAGTAMSAWLGLVVPLFHAVVLEARMDAERGEDNEDCAAGYRVESVGRARENPVQRLWRDALADDSVVCGGLAPLARVLASATEPEAIVAAAAALSSLLEGAPRQVKVVAVEVGVAHALASALVALQGVGDGGDVALARSDVFAAVTAIARDHRIAAHGVVAALDADPRTWDLLRGVAPADGGGGGGAAETAVVLAEGVGTHHVGIAAALRSVLRADPALGVLAQRAAQLLLQGDEGAVLPADPVELRRLVQRLADG